MWNWLKNLFRTVTRFFQRAVQGGQPGGEPGQPPPGEDGQVESSDAASDNVEDNGYDPVAAEAARKAAEERRRQAELDEKAQAFEQSQNLNGTGGSEAASNGSGASNLDPRLMETEGDTSVNWVQANLSVVAPSVEADLDALVSFITPGNIHLWEAELTPLQRFQLLQNFAQTQITEPVIDPASEGATALTVQMMAQEVGMNAAEATQDEIAEAYKEKIFDDAEALNLIDYEQRTELAEMSVLDLLIWMESRYTEYNLQYLELISDPTTPDTDIAAFSTIPLESLNGLYQSEWKNVLHSYAVTEDMNLDVMEWAAHNLQGDMDTSDPLVVEATLRAILADEYQRLSVHQAEFGLPLPDTQVVNEFGLEIVDPIHFPISSLLDQIKNMQFNQLMYLYNANLETHQANQGNFQSSLDQMLSFGGNLIDLPAPTQEMLQLQMSQKFINSLDTAFDPLFDYQPQPDFTLIAIATSILIEPVDWVMSAIQIYDDLSHGDYKSAGINFAFAILPFAGGWMDDALGGIRYAPDDLSFGGGGWSQLLPGTAEHKAARWEEYLTNPDNAGWNYERWSANYELNQVRAREAQARVNEFADTLGWGTTDQKALNVGELGTRRLDIADYKGNRGIEYKSGGYFYRDPDILLELKKDQQLVKKGWTIEWVFEVSDGVSQPLIDDLLDAGISVRINGELAIHSSDMR